MKRNVISLVHHRRQELRELRLLQKEEQRAQQQLGNKLQQQKEQIYRRFEQETTVSHSSEFMFSSDLSVVLFMFFLTLIIQGAVLFCSDTV